MQLKSSNAWSIMCFKAYDVAMPTLITCSLLAPILRNTWNTYITYGMPEYPWHTHQPSKERVCVWSGTELQFLGNLVRAQVSNPLKKTAQIIKNFPCAAQENSLGLTWCVLITRYCTPHWHSKDRSHNFFVTHQLLPLFHSKLRQHPVNTHCPSLLMDE